MLMRVNMWTVSKRHLTRHQHTNMHTQTDAHSNTCTVLWNVLGQNHYWPVLSIPLSAWNIRPGQWNYVKRLICAIPSFIKFTKNTSTRPQVSPWGHIHVHSVTHAYTYHSMLRHMLKDWISKYTYAWISRRDWCYGRHTCPPSWLTDCLSWPQPGLEHTVKILSLPYFSPVCCYHVHILMYILYTVQQ